MPLKGHSAPLARQLKIRSDNEETTMAAPPIAGHGNLKKKRGRSLADNQTVALFMANKVFVRDSIS